MKKNIINQITNQTAPIIKALEREIEITKLAGSIIEARYNEGKDRIPADIYAVIAEIKKLQYMDDPSIYCVLVSHTETI